MFLENLVRLFQLSRLLDGDNTMTLVELVIKTRRNLENLIFCRGLILGFVNVEIQRVESERKEEKEKLEAFFPLSS